MKKYATYEEYLELVPKELKEEFEEIRRGERLPQLYSDFPFKQIYHPDLHKERLTRLFQLVFQEDEQVISSLNGEMAKASLYSKKTITDLLSQLSNNGIANFEMQVSLQEFIAQRMSIYVSDMIMLQYSVSKGCKKSEMTYTDIPHSYLVIFMKESPSIFVENPEFIHVKQECTDTGIILPALSTVVYIELDKCLNYVRENGYPEERRQLCEWLVMMADSNAPEVKQLAKEDTEKQMVLQELEKMSQNKEVLMTMLADKYEEINRYSEWKQAVEFAEARGEARGEAKIIAIIRKNLRKGMSLDDMSLVLDISMDYIVEVERRIEQNIDATDMEIAEAILKK